MTPCRTASTLASVSTPTPPPRPSGKLGQTKRSPLELGETIKKAKATACKSPASITKDLPTPKHIQFTPLKTEHAAGPVVPINPPAWPPPTKAAPTDQSPPSASIPVAKACPVLPTRSMPLSPPPPVKVSVKQEQGSMSNNHEQGPGGPNPYIADQHLSQGEPTADVTPKLDVKHEQGAKEPNESKREVAPEMPVALPKEAPQAPPAKETSTGSAPLPKEAPPAKEPSTLSAPLPKEAAVRAPALRTPAAAKAAMPPGVRVEVAADAPRIVV